MLNNRRHLPVGAVGVVENGIGHDGKSAERKACGGVTVSRRVGKEGIFVCVHCPRCTMLITVILEIFPEPLALQHQ